MRRSRVLTRAVLSGVAVCIGATLSAQAAPSLALGRGPDARDGSRSSPLDRKIVLHLRDVSLREALDRIAAAGRVRLSYSAELLPLDRPARASFDSVALGEALLELLKGIPVTPVVAGPDQVVLAPSRPPPRSAREAPFTLDRVVVTGSTAGGSERPLSIALDVVSGRDLSATGAATMSQALDGSVPGLWLWEQSPASPLARYASIRGASSFGVTYPKIYIDGIEVANPLLFTQLNPESIERVEVIRGPQGAALYGADAISGVVNIILRHESVDSGTPRVHLHSTGGLSASRFTPQAVLAQDHALAVVGGTMGRSGQLDLSYGTLGAFYPGASSNHLLATGGMRLIGTHTSVVGTARLFVDHVGTAVNPLLADPASSSSSGSTVVAAPAAPQSVTEYTVGTTVTLTPSARWTHMFVVGLDGYRLANVANDFTPFPSSADSALRAARGNADRLTWRASSLARFGATDGLATTLTFAAEHSTLRQETPSVPLVDDSGRGGLPQSEWFTNTGATTQADVAFHNTLFLTGGIRLERNDAYVGTARYSTLPMVGGALVHDFGSLTVKLRTAYGKGIRAPRTAERETVLGGFHSQASLTELAPEEQSGVEAGIDLFLGRALTVQVTRFDQLASGLIQQVVIADPGLVPGAPSSRLALQYQNVGAITNRGWEIQAGTQHGPFALRSAVSLVDSRVQRLATGYTGDLRAGDRPLDVPSSTASLTGTWSGQRWSGTLGLARAFDWIEYDRLALARSYTNFDRRYVPLVGADLRGYWRQYSGVTHLRASATHTLGRGLSLLITGENLLDQQRGEPDNATILPGRTITAGVRAAF